MEQSEQKSLDCLLAGIKHLLERSRCPLSPEDQQLLVHCSEQLQRLKALDLEEDTVSLEEISTIVTLILKFLGIFNDLL